VAKRHSDVTVQAALTILSGSTRDANSVGTDAIGAIGVITVQCMRSPSVEAIQRSASRGRSVAQGDSECFIVTRSWPVSGPMAVKPITHPL
jgi:hypothetical protein